MTRTVKSFHCHTHLKLPIKEPLAPQQLGWRSVCGSIANVSAVLHDHNQQVPTSYRLLCWLEENKCEVTIELNSTKCDNSIEVRMITNARLERQIR